jgi:hypothetical protein
MNSIRSAQRLLILTQEREDGPAKERDTLFGLLSTISFVYEGMKTAAGILNQLATDLPKDLHADIAWVIGETKENSSLFNTTLKDIRNGIAFHFNLQIGDEILKEAVCSYPPVFEEGSSDDAIGCSYSLADSVVIQFFCLYDPLQGKPKEKVINLVDRLSSYNVKLCEALDKIIAKLIVDHAEGIHGAESK